MKDLQFDVLVVGAGPAGLAAAASAAASGAAVGLIDDNPQPGGQVWRGGPGAVHTDQAAHWISRAAAPNLCLLTEARVIATLDGDRLIADTTGGPLQLAYGQLILASGARELFLPFPGWTLPGVFGAGGLQALVKGGMPIKGKRVVVAGSGPLLLAVASYLSGKGARVTAVIEQTPWRKLGAFSFHLLSDWDKLRQAGRLGGSLRGVPLRAGAWIVRARGKDRLEAVTVQRDGGAWTLECEYLACGYGLIPNLELPHALGCAVAEGAVRVDERQRTSRDHIYAAGEVTGVAGLEAALAEGRIAGLAATGQEAAARALFPSRVRAHHFAAALARGFALRDELKMLADPDTLICRCEDVPYAALYGHASWRSAKLHTRCGMGPCQGRVCGGASAFLFGWTQDSVRAPITPCTLGSLAQIGAPLKSGEKVVQ